MTARPVARFTAQTTDGWVHLVGIVLRPALASHSEDFYVDRYAGWRSTTVANDSAALVHNDRRAHLDLVDVRLPAGLVQVRCGRQAAA